MPERVVISTLDLLVNLFESVPGMLQIWNLSENHRIELEDGLTLKSSCILIWRQGVPLENTWDTVEWEIRKARKKLHRDKGGPFKQVPPVVPALSR
jgi:hypothetical protein